MPKPVLGLVTIGQAPRTDVTPTFKNILGDSFGIEEIGALDDLNHDDFYKIEPDKNTKVKYVSRLRDGSAINIAKEKMLPLLQSKLNILEKKASIIVILCTGEFEELALNLPTIFPDKLLKSTVISLLNKKIKIGIMAPSEGQSDMLRKKWDTHNIELNVAVSSPYINNDISAKANDLKNSGAEIIILDCIGYTEAHKEIVRKETGLPVILPRSLVANIVNEIF